MKHRTGEGCANSPRPVLRTQKLMALSFARGRGGWGGWRRCVTSAFTCVHMCVHMCPNTCPGGGASMRHKGIPRTASSNSTAGYSCWEAQRVAMSAAQPPCSLSSCFCSSSSSAPRFLCVVGNKRQRGAQLSRNIPTGIWGRYV